MNYLGCSKKEFKEIVGNKKVICIGASVNIQRKYENNKEWFDSWTDAISCFVDNNENKWFKMYNFGEKRYIIYPLEKLHEVKDTIILIATNKKYVLEICKQLDEMGLYNMDVYSLDMILSKLEFDDSAINIPLRSDRTNKKIIHTFWFSGEPLPEQYQFCIDSWKKYCPEYEIKIWNQDNYDITKNRFMHEACMAKRWAFASDYARLDVVYNYGGMYMDMDVEVVRNLDDLLSLPAFFGIDPWMQIDLGTGFGAIKGNTLIKQLLDVYQDKPFFLNTGYNQEAQPVILLDVFKKNGYIQKFDSQICNDTYYLSMNYLNVFEGTTINKYHSNGNEYLIHHHHAGWWTKEKRQARYDENYRDAEILEGMFKYED